MNPVLLVSGGIGIRFEIGKIDSGSYGIDCWKIIWRAVDIQKLSGARLYEGDTAASLRGQENVYCIVLAGTRELGHIRQALEHSAEFRAVAAFPKFVEVAMIAGEPLVEAGEVDAAGNLVGKADNARPALDAVRQERGVPAPSSSSQEGMTFACPHCGQKIEGEEAWAGIEADCPACGKKLTIPGTTASPKASSQNSQGANAGAVEKSTSPPVPTAASTAVMGDCDVCGGRTSWEQGTVYTATEFRKLVSKGFEPDESIIKLGVTLGLPRQEAIAGWKQDLVANSATDWLLCPSCAARAARYMPKKAGTGQRTGPITSEILNPATASRPFLARPPQPRRSRVKGSNDAFVKWFIRIVLVLLVYAGYRFMFAPDHISPATYRQIRQGMTGAQIELLLKGGAMRAGVRGVGDHLATNQSQGQERLQNPSRFAWRPVERPSTSDAIRLEDEFTSDIGALEAQGNPHRITPATVTGWITDGPTVMGLSDDGSLSVWESIKAHLISSKILSRGVHEYSTSGEYNFKNYQVDLLVNGSKHRLLRNGVVHCAQGKVKGSFEYWHGDENQVITLQFTEDKVTYWAYQGPVSSFAVKQVQSQAGSAQSQRSTPSTNVSAGTTRAESQPAHAPQPPKAVAPPPPVDPRVLATIRAGLVAEYDRTLPMWVAGSPVEFYRRGIGARGIFRNATTDSVVVARDHLDVTIPLSELDSESRACVDKQYRRQMIETAVQERLKQGQ